MSHLDPFIVYTVKLAMDFKFQPSTLDNRQRPSTINQPQDDPNHPLFPEMIMRILSVNPLLLKMSERTPKLKEENVLALLYHTDKNWIQSVKELSRAIQSNKSNSTIKINYALNNVHHQQSIFLDTLYVLRKAIMSSSDHRLSSSITLASDSSIIEASPKRFNESIWFAAQVLHHHGKLRHLEHFTEQLRPFASKLYETLEQFRLQLRGTLRRQRNVMGRYKKKSSLIHRNTKRFSVWSIFSAHSLQPSNTMFYDTVHHQQFLHDELEPFMATLIQHWSQFENRLYTSYVHTVFGRHHDGIQPIVTKQDFISSRLPHSIYHDSFTQLLPLTLNRALTRGILDLHMIRNLDPIAFVALPRLAILAGITWLSHLTGWRRQRRVALPQWIQPHKETMECISSALTRLELQLLRAPSEVAHHTFVRTYQRLETALVHGQQRNDSVLEKEVYLDICLVTDSILSNHHSQLFNVILSQLFKHVGGDID
ncbi:MAG: hypothetical protein EXX96DRAFT_123922 [Benjaminiella poitrasii]|nr:MAG: hypothetical protein EXX96DRAFT_123922 [Benjaminiella poitrasii]